MMLYKCCIVICRFSNIYIYTHMHAGYILTQWIKTSEDFFKKIYLSLYCKVCVWKGVGDRTELQYIEPHSYGHQRCVFLVLQGCSTGGPEAHSAGFLYCILLPTGLVPKLHRGDPECPFCWVLAFPTTSCLQLVWSPTLSGAPRAPSAGRWLSLPQHVSDFSGPQLADFLSSPSYIIVQSPTQSPSQSLEWNVWSSSSGNNCHTVQRSLSSGASVYECIMGFYRVPFRQPNPRTRFLSITGHWNVSLPSGASLWNGMFGRVESQYTTQIQWSVFNEIVIETLQRDT